MFNFLLAGMGNLWETYGKLNKEERTTNFDFGYLSTSDCMSCCFTQFSELPFQQPNFNENLLVWESSGNPLKIEESHKFSISNHWFRKKVNASSLHAHDVPCSSSCGCMWVHGTQNDVLVWETYGKLHQTKTHNSLVILAAGQLLTKCRAASPNSPRSCPAVYMLMKICWYGKAFGNLHKSMNHTSLSIIR